MKEPKARFEVLGIAATHRLVSTVDDINPRFLETVGPLRVHRVYRVYRGFRV